MRIDVCISMCCCYIQVSAVYFIDFQATNGADLELHTLSRPVLLDDASPIGGAVKHGDNFKEGATYQGSVTEIKGWPDKLLTFLMLQPNITIFGWVSVIFYCLQQEIRYNLKDKCYRKSFGFLEHGFFNAS